MSDNRYFWATTLSGLTFLVGIVGLSVKSFYPAYHAFLQFCGLSVETCHAVIDSLNPISVVGMAIIIWLMVATAWQILRTNIVVSRLTQTELPRPNFLEETVRRLGLTGRVRFVSGSVLFCSGLLDPKIVIGRSVARILSKRELEAALRHEAYHLHQRDPLKVLIVGSLSRALFFLPMVGALAQNYLSQKEMAADRFAEDQVGRTYLLRALYKVLTKFNPDPDILPGYTAGFAGVREEPVSLEKRLYGSVAVGVVLFILLTINLSAPAAVHARCL